MSPHHETTIEPPRGWVGLPLRELWSFRELVYFLAWRDIKARYRQTLLGASWAVLQPVLMMLVFSAVFAHVVRIPATSVPYSVFALAGLVPWTLVSTGAAQSSASVVASQQLIKKVYFPRLAIPLAAIVLALVNFVPALLVLLGLMAHHDVPLGGRIIWLPALVTFAMAVALGVGLWLAALNVQYRDVQYAVPFLTQLWLYATPVAYPFTMLHPQWRALFALNPLTGVVEGFRWALLGTDAPPGGIIGISVATTVLVLVSGLLYFQRVERVFADVV